MTELDRPLLRKLAEWSSDGFPITSLYLSVDGRRFPRKADYEVRLDELLRSARTDAEAMEREHKRSVEHDLERISSFIREGFERGSTRGLALFSSSGVGLWEELLLPRPVRDRAAVGAAVDVLPLEAMLETYDSMCTALVDYEKARVFLVELGRIEEQADVWDEVPGRHEQGGRAQMRMQRHVDDLRQKHLKHVAAVLFRLYRRRGFDHLVLAGSEEMLADLERDLHDYLRRRVRARMHLPIVASVETVLARSLAVEEELERTRESEQVERLLSMGRSGRAARGMRETLGALSDGRVGELLVSIDLSAPGWSCSACTRLSVDGGSCSACGADLEPSRDVVEETVARALRQGCRVETIVEEGAMDSLGGIGALLRF
jgi:peptide chain release factor subunit 1